MRRPRFTSRNILWFSFLLKAGKFQPTMRLEGLRNLKIFNDIGAGTRDKQEGL
jgi:hypothetical protein